MSGVKQATVSNSLDKTLELVQKGLQECADRTENTGNAGSKDFDKLCKSAEEMGKHLVRELPDDLHHFLSGETEQWETLLNRHDQALVQGKTLAQNAHKQGEKYQTAKRNADTEISTIQTEAVSIRRAIANKFSGYCDSENAKAKKLRIKAENTLETLRSATSFGAAKQSLRQSSATEYRNAQKLAQMAQQEYDRLVSLGRDRMEKQRIAEETERNAKMLNDDIISLSKRIESKNFQKFSAGLYSSTEQREIKVIADMCQAGQFETAITRAKTLKTKLAEAAKITEDAQLAWESAKAAAEKVIADAIEELSKIDRSQLENFSGQPVSEIAFQYNAIANANNLISREDFGGANDNVVSAMNALRNFAEEAATNEELHNRREESTQALMQALYDSNYNTPEYYAMDDSNRLSDICIVAATPNGIGDMVMKINLGGEIDFEVKNIPEGQESLCVSAVHAVQEKAREVGVEFDVTNWARAEDQGKEHINITPARTQEKTVIRSKQGQ